MNDTNFSRFVRKFAAKSNVENITPIKLSEIGTKSEKSEKLCASLQHCPKNDLRIHVKFDQLALDLTNKCKRSLKKVFQSSLNFHMICEHLE